MIVSLEQNNPNIQAEKISTSATPRENVKNTGTVSGVSVDLYAGKSSNDAYKDTPKTREDIVEDALQMDVKANSDF